MTQLHVDAEGRHPRAPALNPRDLMVLDHLAEGTSTAGIASALSISSNTARTRIRRVQRKFDVSDRAAAVRAARELGVLPGPWLCSCR